MTENTQEIEEGIVAPETTQNEEVPTTETPIAEETIEVTAETESPEAEVESTPEEIISEVEAPQEEPVAEITPKTDKSKTETTAAPEPSSDFDWSMDKEGFASYDDGSKQSLIDMYKGTFNQLAENQVVKGTVVALNSKDVVVNVGYKSDGIVNRTEFRDITDLKVGDEVEVFVEKTEDSLGQLILSRRKAIAESAWDKIIAAKDENQIVRGLIKSRTKGGLVVDIMGMDTFLPGSQIDVKPIKDYDVYVGQTMEFKVVKVNQAFKNIVISHKALIEDIIAYGKRSGT